jgi:hypothetical protein
VREEMRRALTSLKGRRQVMRGARNTNLVGELPNRSVSVQAYPKSLRAQEECKEGRYGLPVE